MKIYFCIWIICTFKIKLNNIKMKKTINFLKVKWMIGQLIKQGKKNILDQYHYKILKLIIKHFKNKVYQDMNQFYYKKINKI
jgi:hypothetical protein